jgi:hypothetical protein
MPRRLRQAGIFQVGWVAVKAGWVAVKAGFEGLLVEG